MGGCAVSQDQDSELSLGVMVYLMDQWYRLAEPEALLQQTLSFDWRATQAVSIFCRGRQGCLVQLRDDSIAIFPGLPAKKVRGLIAYRNFRHGGVGGKAPGVPQPYSREPPEISSWPCQKFRPLLHLKANSTTTTFPYLDDLTLPLPSHSFSDQVSLLIHILQYR